MTQAGPLTIPPTTRVKSGQIWNKNPRERGIPAGISNLEGKGAPKLPCMDQEDLLGI